MDKTPPIPLQILEHPLSTVPDVVVDIPGPPSHNFQSSPKETSPPPLPTPTPVPDIRNPQTTGPTDVPVLTNLPADDTVLDEPDFDEEQPTHPYYKLTLNQHKELWEAYNKQADEYDKVLIRRLNEDLNTLLIFVSISSFSIRHFIEITPVAGGLVFGD